MPKDWSLAWALSKMSLMSPSFEIDRSVMLVDHNGSTLAIELPGSRSRVLCEFAIIVACDDDHKDKPGGIENRFSGIGSRLAAYSMPNRWQPSSFIKLLSVLAYWIHHSRSSQFLACFPSTSIRYRRHVAYRTVSLEYFKGHTSGGASPISTQAKYNPCNTLERQIQPGDRFGLSPHPQLRPTMTSY